MAFLPCPFPPRRLCVVALLYTATLLCIFVAIPTTAAFSPFLPQSVSTTTTRPPVLKVSTDPTLASEKNVDKKKVLFQKVVRPHPYTEDGQWIGTLIGYLQQDWELPSDLPMVYHSVELPEESRFILSWDSSLSPNPAATQLNVQVVGIRTDDDDDDEQKKQDAWHFSMAMVVVSKSENDDAATLPPMLQNLFADSERRIITALDRSLQDYTLEGPPRTVQKASGQDIGEALKSLAQEVQADVVQEDDIAKSSSSSSLEPKTKKPAFVDAQVVEPVTPESPSGPSNPPVADFAVQAAQKAVAEQQRQGVQDYAVQAAKLAAQLRKQDAKKQRSAEAKKPIKSMDQEPTQEASVHSEVRTRSDSEAIGITTPQRPPILDYGASSRAFHRTVSRPTDYKKRIKQTQKTEAGSSMVASVDTETESPVASASSAEIDSVREAAPELKDRQQPEAGKKKPPSVEEPLTEALLNPPVIDKELLDPVDREMLEATEEALQEISDQAPDMSPEELLQDVLKFDQDKEADGFARGALDMAKDLLKERDEKVHEQSDKPVGVRELSPDEELRRMFEAGERIAEGRITVTPQGPSSELAETNESEEKRVDSLITDDKTISKHARVLDDELVELEARINPTPGEEFDGPRRSKTIFDVFSGPEVYDPNVDPETAVNWPGAMPGTRKIRLPKELDEAVAQATFAAQVLMKMHEHQASGVSTPLVVGGREVTPQQVENLKSVVEEAVEIGLIDDPVQLMEEASRLQMLVDEIWTQPEERVREIASNYKDLLLSENFVDLVKDRLNKMADRDLDALRQDDDSLEEPHAREREILGQIVVFAQLLLKEARALGAELEAQQLEVIRSICKVAMNPSHQTEEETAMALTDAVRDMRPLLDDGFVAYLKYAVAEEEGRLARAGLLDDPEHNQWLFVLKIVQQGVYAELAKGINRYLEHIWYVLRMETPEERRLLLKKLIDVMPTLDVRPFVQVVQNIVGSLGDGVKGEFDGVVPLGEMTNKLLQLHRDMKELLPPERIAVLSRDADEWAAARKKRLVEQRGITKQRLKAARQTEHLDEEIDSFGRRGEVERFD